MFVRFSKSSLLSFCWVREIEKFACQLPLKRGKLRLLLCAFCVLIFVHCSFYLVSSICATDSPPCEHFGELGLFSKHILPSIFCNEHSQGFGSISRAAKYKNDGIQGEIPHLLLQPLFSSPLLFPSPPPSPNSGVCWVPQFINPFLLPIRYFCRPILLA